MSRKQRKKAASKTEKKRRKAQSQRAPAAPSALESSVVEAVQQKILDAGFDPVQVTLDKRRHLRVLIDRPPPPPGSPETADGAGLGVRILDCQQVSQACTAAITELGRDPGGYHIEVASPGVDRPLTRPEHFERFRGQEVTLRVREPRGITNRRSFTGTLLGADDGTIRLKVIDTGEEASFPREEVTTVRLKPSFPGEPKSSKGGRG